MGDVTATATQDCADPIPNAQTVRLLCDLAVKRHDLAERSFDALNTRLGVVFAFNSFLLPASIAALGGALGRDGALSRWAIPAIVVWAVSLLTVTIATAIGFLPQEIKSIPDPVVLYRSYGMKDPAVLDAQVIGDLGAAWKTITSATDTKSKCLIFSIGAVAVELILLVVVAANHILR